MRVSLVALLMMVATQAHADPTVTATAEQTAPEPRLYVQAGGMAGVNGMAGNDGQLIIAGTLDGGVRLFDSVWAHAMVAEGHNVSLNSDASFRQLRAGGEYRLGGDDRSRVGTQLYALVGADVGVQRIRSESIYWDGTPPDNMRVVNQTLVIPRIGIGGASDHVQAGVVAEAALDGALPDGFDIIATLGARF